SSVFLFSLIFFFSCSCDHRDLHSFPTRRSSDLTQIVICRGLPSSAAASKSMVKSGMCSNALLTIRPRTVSVDNLSSLQSTEPIRSEEHTSELQSPCNLVCRLLLEKKKKKKTKI